MRTRLTVPCEQCGAPKIRHRVCPSCGTYKRELVINKNA